MTIKPRPKRGNRYKHGMSDTPPHRMWLGMINRCHLETNDAYKWYGARGIYVCDRWRNSFADFWADMGPTYKKGLSLERRDNDGPYSPENCYWATTLEQGRNKRNNRIIDTPNGRMHLAEAARQSGLSPDVLTWRLIYRWPTENLFKPKGFRQWNRWTRPCPVKVEWSQK